MTSLISIRVMLVVFLQPTWGLASQYLWNEKTNFTLPENCQVKQVDEIGFKVLLNPFSNSKKLIIEDISKRKQSTTFVMELNGSNGRLVPSSLTADIANFVFELNPEKITQNIESNFWQVATGNNKYFIFDCIQGRATKKYIMFNVFAAHSQLPVGQIGVSEDDAILFSDMTIHLPQKADEILDKKLEKQTAPTVPSQQAVATPDKQVEKENQKDNNVGTSTQKNIGDVPPPQSDEVRDLVVCSIESKIPVYDETLSKVVFTVEPQSEIRLFQDWEKKEYKKKISGKEMSFEKVQFPNREFGSNIGFVSQTLIKSKRDCGSKPIKTKKVDEPKLSVHSCCVFPTIGHPTRSYREGMRRFGASRAGGKRIHAACDLYREKDEDIVSVAQGIILRNKYYFYQGTYALEVRHDSGFVVRYGEVTGKSVQGVFSGASVEPGQTIAYMGKVNSGCCDAMLHFELYAGNIKGGLTQPKRKGYQRRADLMNPTRYLRIWESQTFGDSY